MDACLPGQYIVSSGVWLAPEAAATLKIGVAAATAALLLAGLILRRTGHAAAFRRTRDGFLLVLGILGGVGWWNFFSVPRYVHLHDGYHYFVGAKYFPELGYERLYVCTVIADIEAGLGDNLVGRRVRNLETNILERGTELALDPPHCKAHFSPERWTMFTEDIAWFRAQLPVSEWRRLQMDHGFNGSPVWLLAGRFFASAHRGAESWFFALSLLDPVLLLAMWLGVVWTFGWRAACVAAVFWGTNGFADFTWTGGSFLRQDWLVALVLAIAALDRRRPAVAGALVTFSALLRVFPGFAAAALVLKSGVAALRAHTLRPSRDHLRFAGGCVLALVLLLPLATGWSGPAAWTGFAANSRKLLATPLLNQMGLRTVLAYDSSSRASVLERPQAADPYLVWKLAQRRQFAERWWIFAAIAALYTALLIRALPHQDDWVVLALGTGAIPIATQLTCYYHAALLGLALLWIRREMAGVAVCTLAAVTQAIRRSMPISDELFVWMSMAEVVTVLFVTVLFASPSRAKGEQGPAPDTATVTPVRATASSTGGTRAPRGCTCEGS